MDDQKALIERELGQQGEKGPMSPALLKLRELRITTETNLSPVEFLFRLFGRPCFPRGELVGVAGKAKSGKTLFTSMLMACCHTPEMLALERKTEPLRVFWYDTEQSESSTQEILRDRIAPMTSGHTDFCMAFNVRSINWSKRMALLEEGVGYYRPDMVVVDGIRDLVDDINNGVLAQDIIDRLMRLASRCHCCIVCVLHQNKGGEDRNLRGWIGTELMNKAYEVYVCEKLMPERIFSVEQTLTRKYDIGQLMYFRVDDQGLPIASEPPVTMASTTTASEGSGPLNRNYVISRQNGFDIDLRRLFHEVLKNGPRYYSDMQKTAMRELNCHDSGFWNKQFAMARDQGIIVRYRNDENKYAWALPQPVQQPTQPNLFDASADDAPPF